MTLCLKSSESKATYYEYEVLLPKFKTSLFVYFKGFNLITTNFLLRPFIHYATFSGFRVFTSSYDTYLGCEKKLVLGFFLNQGKH